MDLAEDRVSSRGESMLSILKTIGDLSFGMGSAVVVGIAYVSSVSWVVRCMGSTSAGIRKRLPVVSFGLELCGGRSAAM